MKITQMLEKKINERQKKQKVKIFKKVIASAMAGIAAGIVGGVFMSPKSGIETIDDIVKIANGLGENAITKTVEMKETFANKIVEIKINAIMAKEKTNEYLSDKKVIENNKNKDEVIIEENKSML